MCSCIGQMDEVLKDKNITVDVGWRFMGNRFIGMAIISTSRLDTKKRGKLPTLYATFCPFCGEKYPEVLNHEQAS